MTDAGFFRGTSSDQDNRFADKQKKLLKELNYAPILNTKLNMSKIDVNSLKPWIETKIKEILEKDDELLSDSIYEHLAEKEPDGKNILVIITSFVDENKASRFMEELWTRLIDLQDNSNGVTCKSTELDPDNELKPIDSSGEEIAKPDKLNVINNNSNDASSNKVPQDENRSSGSSHPVSPPSRSVSKSPGSHRLDERSRGRPRKRAQDDTSRDNSNPQNSDKRHSRSRSHSKGRSMSHSRSKSPPRKSPGGANVQGESRRRSQSRSSSRSRNSGSGSRSPTRSRSYSRSRSSSRSPANRRSPYGHPYRGRRSRSRSHGYRPRSRSPRGRRVYSGGGVNHRGPYRGSSFGFQDRRRGTIGPMRRRVSPWGGRRRYSPRSPPRRRRSPSYSPRRRRSRSPYHRRQTRSRSPPAHMIPRNVPSPRSIIPGPSGHLDMMGRHMPHHEVHRQMLPQPRSPRGPIEHRNYGDSGQLVRRPSLEPMNKLLEQQPPAASHSLVANQPGTSVSRLYSPPSASRKKHKRDKDKKHRKHKKSKKHRSASPEKKKKHKKHKKHSSKKHKSH